MPTSIVTTEMSKRLLDIATAVERFNEDFGGAYECAPIRVSDRDGELMAQIVSTRRGVMIAFGEVPEPVAKVVFE